ncbi:MAG: dephospho-CoA kinase [Bacteroidota bacterium]
MSRWPGKYVIGLTGNIATGKSVVRRMLEHLGAYTIDADALAHRAIARGAPGYQPVVDQFGRWLLDKTGEIDRAKLGRLVFADPEALLQLEEIVHPLVRQAVNLLTGRARQPVIVLEAIKLLESELRTACDSIWVTDAPRDVQVARLMRKRGLSREDALQRVQAQSAQSEKVSAADVVIRNTGTYEKLWEQVSAQWKKISAGAAAPRTEKVVSGNLEIRRGRPRDSKSIAELITRLSGQEHKLSAEDVMAAFGDKAYMLLRMGGRLVGLAGWQVENLVARTTDLYLEDHLDPQRGLEALVREIERASRDLQCEAALIFPGEKLAGHTVLWNSLGYERRAPEALGVQAWKDAAAESMPDGGRAMFFKQLRQDRVLRPI